MKRLRTRPDNTPLSSCLPSECALAQLEAQTSHQTRQQRKDRLYRHEWETEQRKWNSCCVVGALD